MGLACRCHSLQIISSPPASPPSHQHPIPASPPNNPDSVLSKDNSILTLFPYCVNPRQQRPPSHGPPLPYSGPSPPSPQGCSLLASVLFPKSSPPLTTSESSLALHHDPSLQMRKPRLREHELPAVRWLGTGGPDSSHLARDPPPQLTSPHLTSHGAQHLPPWGLFLPLGHTS